MNDDVQTTEVQENVCVSGQLSRSLGPAPLRVLATVTGLILVSALVSVIARYLFVLRNAATASVEETTLKLSVQRSLFGKVLGRREMFVPLPHVKALEVENRERYLHLVVGFGFLAIGIFAGVHWLLDGLRAGYPYLALVGGGVILAGVALDVALYLFVPDGDGNRTVKINSGVWCYRLRGVDAKSAEAFVSRMKEGWTAYPADS